MPYSPRFGDHFYSSADGRLECDHVFVKGNDLPRRLASASRFTVAETGFGTGLNFTETWRQWKLIAPAGARLEFVSFERYPLDRPSIRRALSVWPEIGAEVRALSDAWPDRVGGGDITISFGPVTLSVVTGPAEETISRWEGRADAWYLDGFAPSRNPDMWSVELMSEIARHTVPGGGFATYTSAGWVRRNLAAAGFTVHKQPGFAGKREMCRGTLD